MNYDFVSYETIASSFRQLLSQLFHLNTSQALSDVARSSTGANPARPSKFDYAFLSTGGIVLSSPA
jgi:hypothetical protein